MNRMVEHHFGQKPEAWKQRKQELMAKRPGDDELYEIASQEFGLIQVRQEILSLLDFVRKESPEIVGEIGLKHGGNSFMFLHALPTLRHLVSLDIQLHNTAKLDYFAGDGQKITFLEGDSQSRDVANRTAKVLDGRKFDFLFIDGDHSYEGVRNDFINYYAMVRKGGIICFHDIVPDHATKFGKAHQEGEIYAGGVHLLWQELKPHYQSHEFVADWEQSGFGIGAIVKPDDASTPAL